MKIAPEILFIPKGKKISCGFTYYMAIVGIIKITRKTKEVKIRRILII